MTSSNRGYNRKPFSKDINYGTDILVKTQQSSNPDNRRDGMESDGGDK